MRSFIFRISLLVFFISNTYHGFCQPPGITSGATYTLISKLNNKVLNVSNSSIEDGAIIDTWPDTNSDAQKWVVALVGNNVYTLTNVASGKLLHITTLTSESAKIDQLSASENENAKWTISNAGKGFFYIKPAAAPGFSLNIQPADTFDGINIALSAVLASDSHKWVFRKENNNEPSSPAAIADRIFDAWYKSFNIESVKGYFWDNAEMIEVVLDAYEVTNDPKYKLMYEAMFKNFIEKNGADWQNNKYNDDIAWASLFSVRGYLLTGNKAYLEKAKDQFDKMYARAFTNAYGGGLTWYQTKTSKNSCINGPAMVACCYLARATGDSTYYDKAIALYTWSKVYLFDAATGKLNDNVDLDKKPGQLKISTWSSTYNQGTYLGAAVMLYQYTKESSYLSEAQKIAVYIRDNMYKSKVMDNEYNGNDLPGFKGIFARYARMYTVELEKTDLVEWLSLNASVAYNNRNSENLIHTRWATRTPEAKPKSAFGCSSAVSLLINSLPFSNIERR